MSVEGAQEIGRISLIYSSAFMASSNRIKHGVGGETPGSAAPFMGAPGGETPLPNIGETPPLVS